MSQNDLTIDCAQTGTAYTSALNSALGSLNSMHSGTVAPTLNLADGMLWLDTNAADFVVKIYTGGSWYTLFDWNGVDYDPIILGITDDATAPVLTIDDTGISMGDSDIIKLGDSADLEIQHNGTNSVIKDTGTGSLLIQSSTALSLQDADGNNFAVFTDEGTGGKVELYNTNAIKLVTTATGIDVTGSTVVSERFEADTDDTAPAGDNSYFYQKTGIGASVSGTEFSIDTGTTGTRTESLRIDTSGNVGIGTTSPDARLEVTDTAPVIRITDDTESASWADGQVMGTLEFYSEDISGNAPYDTAFISSYNDTPAGSLPSGALVFGTATYDAVGGAVEKMRLTSNGYLGIGTTPDRHLHVSAGSEDVAAKFESSDANVTVEFTDTTGTSTIVCADDFTFQSSGVDTMHIDSAGNLGVGVSPEASWDTTHSAIRLGDQGLIANDTDEGIAIGSNYKTTDIAGFADRFIETDYAARHSMYNGLHALSYSTVSGSADSAITWTDGLTMDTSGNVNIVGTLDATAITGTAIVGTSLAAGAGAITGATLTTTGAIAGTTINGTAITATSVDLGDNEKITLGVGNDLEIYHDASDSLIKDVGTGNFKLCGDNIYLRNAADTESMLRATQDGSIQLYHNNVLKLETTSAGVDITGALVATGDVTAFSDEKLKENVEVIHDALEKISKINGVTFTRNDLDHDRRHTGVIAQEVQKVLPEAVEDHNGTLAVAYGNMVGLLIEGMKEQQKQINELKELVIGGR